jgi:hypothetical protein
MLLLRQQIVLHGPKDDRRTNRDLVEELLRLGLNRDTEGLRIKDLDCAKPILLKIASTKSRKFST